MENATKEKETRLNIRLEPRLLERLDVVCARLGGCTRTHVIKMLLSSDPKVLRLLFEKAQHLVLDTSMEPGEPGQLTWEEVANSKSMQKKRSTKKALPDSENDRQLADSSEKNILAGIQDDIVLFSEFGYSDSQAESKSKHEKKQKVSPGIDHSEERRQIIEHFNLKSGRSLSYNSKENIKAVDKMLDEGKLLSEFILIICNQCYWWKDVHPEKFENLFPETIFRPSHWNRYLANTPPDTNVSSLSKDSGRSVGSDKASGKSKKYDNFYL